MAQSVVIPVSRLDAGMVLAPERYDPRRGSVDLEGVTVADLADIVADQMAAKSDGVGKQLLVLDTGHAYEGVINQPRETTCCSELGSAKKRLQPGDVIISRLRPYLRQVAFVDASLFQTNGRTVDVVCSTEFFVLRPRTNKSLAFLVPYLLTEPVQSQLAAAQEGGHHPRFNQITLRSLIVPNKVLESSEEVAKEVERAVAHYRQSQHTLRALCRSEQEKLVDASAKVGSGASSEEDD